MIFFDFEEDFEISRTDRTKVKKFRTVVLLGLTWAGRLRRNQESLDINVLYLKNFCQNHRQYLYISTHINYSSKEKKHENNCRVRSR